LRKGYARNDDPWELVQREKRATRREGGCRSTREGKEKQGSKEEGRRDKPARPPTLLNLPCNPLWVRLHV
jgi:hypothetical protein